MHHEEYADEIKRRIAQLQPPVDGIADIATDVVRINVSTSASSSTEVSCLFNSTPAMMSPTRQGSHRVARQKVHCMSRPHLTTPHWHQFLALGTIHRFTASAASSLNNTGIFSPRGLQVTLLRAISTLAILALCILPDDARS
jgi:hypothetical protein